jgi:hypothetical protein
MITETAKQRSELLGSMSLAFGTLRSAVSNVNIGEGIEGCELSVTTSREIALKQIERLRKNLSDLKKTLGDTNQ